jgi:hypothetical protein
MGGGGGGGGCEKCNKPIVCTHITNVFMFQTSKKMNSVVELMLFTHFFENDSLRSFSTCGEAVKESFLKTYCPSLYWTSVVWASTFHLWGHGFDSRCGRMTQRDRSLIMGGREGGGRWVINTKYWTFFRAATDRTSFIFKTPPPSSRKFTTPPPPLQHLIRYIFLV